jgi:hypothetical protein
MLPFPFGIQCGGNLWNNAGPLFQIHGTNVQLPDVKDTPNLSAANASNAECLAVKAIITSHTHRFEDRCADFKASKRVKRLSPSQKRQLAARISPSSAFHFLYRLRLRSNYDDPMMFMAGQNDADVATNHYMNLHRVTYVLISLLQEILLAVLDSADVFELRKTWRRYSTRFPKPEWPKFQ